MEKQLPESCWLVASNIFQPFGTQLSILFVLIRPRSMQRPEDFPRVFWINVPIQAGGNHTCHAIADFKMQNTFGFEEVCLYLLVACWGVPLSHWVRSCQMSYCSMVVTCKKEECLETEHARLPFRWGQGAIFCCPFSTGKRRTVTLT